MSENIVEIRHVVKEFDGIPVVDDLSLTIGQGEFFSILGPSGSGKTTTLRLLAGFEKPTRGEVLINGQSMVGVPPHLRPVNTVFQSYALFPHMTVLDNIGFGLRMRGIAESDVRRQVSDVLELVRLTGKTSRLPSQLSGGEQQRVALARALVNRPSVLLLDEPLGALDQQLRQAMQQELKALQKEVGLTFLCVTHHQEEALTMSDRIAVMNQGRILQVGTPAEIYEHPQESFVSQFIGTSNHLTVKLVAKYDGYGLAHPDSAPDCSIKIPLQEGMSIGDQRHVAIRPERVHLEWKQPSCNGENSLEGRIEHVVYTGHEWLYDIRLTEDTQWKVRMTNAGKGNHLYAVGDVVQVCWDIDDMRLLLD